MDAFEALTQAIKKIPKNKKVVLFFDEFPWMATRRSKLVRALELYWNRYWVFDDRIKLVICGSATRESVCYKHLDQIREALNIRLPDLGASAGI